ncbi:Abi-domain-containing protein [Stipitochalara longipes BDJ]|nr:Abi-domain-containing protein [Stipitochalara longipes BDJ]
MAPAFYSWVKAYYTGVEPEAPIISTSSAVLLLIAYTLLYVLPFYISPTTRPSPQLSRDAPSVIRGRIRLVTSSCIVCSTGTFVLLSSVGSGSPLNSLHLMGYFPIGVAEAVRNLGLIAILFLGPLFEAGAAEGRWRDWIRLRGLSASIGSWIGWRNLVAGPVTEEVLFRSASVPLLLLSHTSNTTIIFLTPIIFGLAHVHHFYEFRISHPHTPVTSAFLRSILQFTYTTLFGGYATFIYLRSGSLLSVILVHSFCNWMGFPRFWGRITSADTVMGPDVGVGKRDENGSSAMSHGGRLGIIWTIIYYFLLVVGALAWWRLLWPLTESGSTLTKF